MLEHDHPRRLGTLKEAFERSLDGLLIVEVRESPVLGVLVRSPDNGLETKDLAGDSADSVVNVSAMKGKGRGRSQRWDE